MRETCSKTTKIYSELKTFVYGSKYLKKYGMTYRILPQHHLKNGIILKKNYTSKQTTM